MHIDFTKCPYVVNLLRKGFSLEQAMLLYKFERRGVNVSVLHYKQFSVQQLEFLCKTVESAKYVRKTCQTSVESLINLDIDL